MKDTKLTYSFFKKNLIGVSMNGNLQRDSFFSTSPQYQENWPYLLKWFTFMYCSSQAHLIVIESLFIQTRVHKGFRGQHMTKAHSCTPVSTGCYCLLCSGVMWPQVTCEVLTYTWKVDDSLIQKPFDSHQRNGQESTIKLNRSAYILFINNITYNHKKSPK